MFFFLASHLNIWSWYGHASLNQDGFQPASSPSFCPSPRPKAFSVHALSWETHKNAVNQDPLLLLVSYLGASAGDQLQLLSLGPDPCLRSLLRDVDPPPKSYWEDDGQWSIFCGFFRLTLGLYTLPNWGHGTLLSRGPRAASAVWFGLESQDWFQRITGIPLSPSS